MHFRQSGGRFFHPSNNLECKSSPCVGDRRSKGEVLPGRSIPQDLRTVWPGPTFLSGFNLPDCTHEEMSAGLINSPSHAQSYLSTETSQQELEKSPPTA